MATADERPIEALTPREAALREILDVISRSRDDEGPVFDVILENAARLCEAPMATLQLVNDTRSHLDFAAHWGDSITAYEAGFSQVPLEGDHIVARTVRYRKSIQVADIADEELYRNRDPVRVSLVEEEGVRTFLAVPVTSGDQTIGTIALYRRHVKTFAPDQIALVETFAAQAVIAIENVRQFRELQMRLEREKATGEVLGVISTNNENDAPVFDVILENAARLCNAEVARLSVINEAGTALRYAAQFGPPSEGMEVGVTEWPLHGTQGIAVAVRTGEVVHIPDYMDTDLYREGDPTRVMLVERDSLRSALVVPLLGADGPIGVIAMHRAKPGPFSDDEIGLVRTFAAQAVIAIENVRQFRALETLNAELGDRVEKQVGEIERMGRLKRFLPSQVADAVVSQGDDMLSSHRALIATLFCDIRGFTAFCERAEPEETIEVLQTYHEEMGRLLDEHGAGVDHRSGDGIMAIFNDPLPCDDPAGDAVRLALAMREKMEELCLGWKRLGHRLGFGVGVSLGYATVGMVGSEGRYEYTASGTAVNLASRLCDEAEDGEILISPRAFAAVEGHFEIGAHGEVTLKGIQEPVPTFRVIGPAA